MKRTLRRRKRRIRHQDAHKRAQWYLGRGYPAKYIAWKVGVHYKTVEAWSRKGNASNRTVLRLAARIARLEPHHRAKLIATLSASAGAA